MPQVRTTTEILEIAKVCEYLSLNETENKVFLRGGVLDARLPLMIFAERKSVQWRHEKNSADSTLRGTSNYLFDLLGRYSLLAENIIGEVSLAKPVVSGPPDQTINGSGTASFTISVAPGLPYTIAWYKDGVLVPGQTGLTYTYPATLADNGDQVRAIVTNAAGSTASRTATLTVNTALIGYFYYGDTDYFTELDGGEDNITYNFTFPITDNAPFNITLPSGAANNKWEVIKVPASQPVKSQWLNVVGTNYGTIPDQAYRSYVTIGDWNYIISRNALSMDTTQPLIIS